MQELQTDYLKQCWRCEEPYQSPSAFPLELCEKCWGEVKSVGKVMLWLCAFLWWVVPPVTLAVVKPTMNSEVLKAIAFGWILGLPVLAGLAYIAHDLYQAGWFRFWQVLTRRQRGR